MEILQNQRRLAVSSMLSILPQGRDCQVVLWCPRPYASHQPDDHDVSCSHQRCRSQSVNKWNVGFGLVHFVHLEVPKQACQDKPCLNKPPRSNPGREHKPSHENQQLMFVTELPFKVVGATTLFHEFLISKPLSRLECIMPP